MWNIMSDEEYIIIKTKITNTKYGTSAEHKLKKMHICNGENGLTPEFKDSLWDDYQIDIDELLEEYGDREDISKLLV